MAGPKKTNNQNIYDGVFDFIWGAQKSGKNKPFPKHGEGFSGYTSSLIEIGTQPLIFPLEQTFGVVDGAIEAMTTVNLGNVKKYGLGDTGKFNLNPKKLLNPSKLGTLRPRDKWAGVGGGLHYNADAALLSLYAKHNGASAQTAYKSGQLFGDIIKNLIKEAELGKFEYSKNNPNYNSLKNAIFTNKTFEEIDSYNTDNRFMNEGINLVVDSIIKTERTKRKNLGQHNVQQQEQPVNDILQGHSKEEDLQALDAAVRQRDISQKLQNQPAKRERGSLEGQTEEQLPNILTETSLGQHNVQQQEQPVNDILQGHSKEEVLQALDTASKQRDISQRLQNQLANIERRSLEEPIEDQLPNTLTKKDLLRIINELQREPDKAKRLLETEEFLKSKGVTQERSKTISSMIWGGNDPTNFGVYRIDRNDVRGMIANKLTDYKIDPVMIREIEEQISRGGLKSDKMIEEIIERKIGQNIEAKNRIANIIKDRRRKNITNSEGRDINQEELISAIKNAGLDLSDTEIHDMLSAAERFNKDEDIDALVQSNFINKGLVLDLQKAKQDAYILTHLKLNDGKNIALNSILISNANEYFHKQGILNPTEEQILQRIKETRFMVNPQNRNSFGSRIERSLLKYRWLTESGTWGPTLLSGKWEDFAKDSNFAKLVEEVDVKGADGKSVGKYFKPANTVAGRLFGNAYYLHPINFLKGAFVDGSFWLKLSCDANGKLDTKKFTYLLSQMNLRNLTSPFRNMFQSITNKIYGMVSPMFVGMKRIVGTLLKRILGATGVGGWIASKLIEMFSDKIAAAVNQIVMVIFYGVIAILVMFVVSFSGDTSNKEIESYLNNQEKIEQTNISKESTFTDRDFIKKE